jgi:hypothetical protein
MKSSLTILLVLLAAGLPALASAQEAVFAREHAESSYYKASLGDTVRQSLSDRGHASAGDRVAVSLGDSAQMSLGDRAAQSLDDGLVAATLEDELEITNLRTGDLQSPFVPAVFGEAWMGSGGKGSFGGCGHPGCGKGGACDGCVRRSLLARSYVGVEYLHWYSSDRRLPPLVTTSPPGTAAADAGRLDRNATSLFGGDDMGGDLQAGGRFTFGVWLDDCRQRSLGLRLYGNEGISERFSATSDGNPILAIPFFDTNPLVGDDAAFLIAHPAIGQGSINASAANDVLGGELFGRALVGQGCNYRLDFLAGYQFNRIDDDLVMTSSVTTAQPVTTTLVDVFDAQNEFHAGEIGLAAEFYRGCWTISMLGKVALGNMNQRVDIDGDFSVVGGGAPATGAGGLFTQPTNIGVYERDVVAYSPEANFKISYALNDCWDLSVGYTFIYWTRVAMAGDQIDTNVNSTQLTGGALAGSATPAFNFDDSDFWVQTVDIGVTFNY